MSAVFVTVAPIFGLIALGLAAARFEWLTQASGKGLADFTFLIAMPALLFRTMVVSEMGDASPALLLTSYFSVIAMIWVLATIVSLFVLRRPPAESAVFAMTASYSNIVLLGIPIALAAYGDRAAPTAAIIVSMHVATLWLAACLHLALAEGARAHSLGQLARIVATDVARNPIVVAIVIGVIWRATGFGLHVSVDRLLSLLSNAGVPCALFAVGFSLAGFRIAGETRALVASLILKNVLSPVLAWVVLRYAFGVPALPASVVTLFAAMPTGTATFLFASRNNLALQTTSATVAVSTAAAMVTLPIVLLWLGQP